MLFCGWFYDVQSKRACFIMARSDKFLTGRIPPYRKPKNVVCGWDVPSLFDDIGIVPWMKLQTQYHDKKESQKSKPPDDVVHFKHLTNKKCSALEDQTTFEKESLHEHFFERLSNTIPKIRRQRTSLLPQQSPVSKPITGNLPINGEYRQFTSAKEYRHSKILETRNIQFIKGYHLPKNDNLSSKRKLKTTRLYNVKDDMDAFSSEDENNDTDDSNARRSKSVPVGENIEFQIARNAKLRRLLKIARVYGSKENLTLDEDEEIFDEGYGSKTPSAEDKEEDRRTKPFNLMTWSITGQGLGNRENSTLFSKQTIGKFSYTHQGNKSQLYGDSEDDKDDKESAIEMSARIRYYQQKFAETPREKGDYEKLLERTYSAMGKSNEGAPSYNLDIKPVTMVLRKITIQDSKESNKSNEPKEIEGLPKTYLFRTNTSFPTERIPEKNQYSDRTQLQMGNTSPEFKFSNNASVTSQTVAKKLLRPSSKADLFKRTHLPYFDFERASTNMPIGDLLPAVDRSILSKSISKSTSDPNMVRSLPNTARDIGAMTRAVTEVVDKPKTDEEVSYFSMDFMYPGKTQVLGAPPFRTNTNQKVQEQSKSKLQKSNTFNHPSQQPKSETKPRIIPSSTQQQQQAANIGYVNISKYLRLSSRDSKSRQGHKETPKGSFFQILQ